LGKSMMSRSVFPSDATYAIKKKTYDADEKLLCAKVVAIFSI